MAILGAPAASVAGAEPSLTGRNVIDYEAQAADGSAHYVFPRFETSRRVIVQGEHTARGGCEFRWSSRLRPGEHRTSVELAYDPDTCRSLYQTGTLAPGESLPGVADGVRTKTEEVTARSAQRARHGSGQVSIEGVGDRHHAWSETWFQDPFTLRVNSVKEEIEWTPGGTCTLAAGTTATMVASYSYFWPTGWFLESGTWTNSGDIIDCNDRS